MRSSCSSVGGHYIVWWLLAVCRLRGCPAEAPTQEPYTYRQLADASGPRPRAGLHTAVNSIVSVSIGAADILALLIAPKPLPVL